MQYTTFHVRQLTDRNGKKWLDRFNSEADLMPNNDNTDYYKLEEEQEDTEGE